MPCDSISTISIDLGKVDPGLIQLALREMGLSNITQTGTRVYFGRGEYIDTATGQSQLAAGREVAEIKRAYSAQVVQATAKRFGWQIKQNAQDKYKYQIIKR